MNKQVMMLSFFLSFIFLLLLGCSTNEKNNNKTNDIYASLPDISTFEANPSERFLVDIEYIDAGHPFKGLRANTPHHGAHVHWDNTTNKWPSGGTNPTNYPAIYAVSDGYVDAIEETVHDGANDRYSIDIAFARKDSLVYLFHYNIEPMTTEPSADFYARFINVVKGQKVKKGDVIAYMYVPAGAGIGTHIHFSINYINFERTALYNTAPAIFSDTVVDAFSAKWGAFACDVTPPAPAGSIPIPSCMGYMLNANENPFGDAIDVLK